MDNFFKFIGKNKLLFIIIIVTFIYLAYNNFKISKKMSTLTYNKDLTTFSNNTEPIVYSIFNNSFVIVTSVDVKMLDYDAKEKWVYSQMYTEPSLVSNENYFAIWNNNSNGNIDIFNQKGFSHKINSTNKILDVYINKNGYLSLLTKDDENGYFITVYDNSGQTVLTRVAQEPNLLPVSTAVSDDNKVLAISEIDTNPLSPNSYVTLSYIDYKDNVDLETSFSGITYNGEIIPKIEFSGNHLLAYSFDKIHVILTANDTTKEVSTLTFNNQVEFCEIIDDKYISVILGIETSTSEHKANTLVFYNFNGTEISNIPLKSKTSNLTPAKNGVVICSGRKVTKVSSNGNIAFEYSHNRDLQNAYYIGNKVPIIIAENDKIISLIENR